MARAATSRLKVNPQLGTLPVLQYCSPDQLQVDTVYQRSLDVGTSQTLIRRIAMHWDWGLCQPLFVARRSDGGMYVVDGQHRLEAARLRGDIWQLPCVVTTFATAADESAAFVALNQQRRPLTQLDLFKAALAAGDFESSQIAIAIEDAGLTLANNTNNHCMKPGQLANVAGIRKCYRVKGLQVLSAALDVLSQAYKGEQLKYAGTIFNGIAAIVAVAIESNPDFGDSDQFIAMTEMVRGATQAEWIADINRMRAEHQIGSMQAGAERTFKQAWAECTAELLDEAA